MKISFLLLLAIFQSASLLARAPACKADVSILDPVFGGAYVPIGDGTTDDTQAIQNVLDYRVCTKDANGKVSCAQPCEPPVSVFFPTPQKAYLVSSLKIRAGSTLRGTGRLQPGIRGNGSGPTLIADNLVLNFTILRLSVTNTKFPAIQITNRSSDFNLLD